MSDTSLNDGNNILVIISSILGSELSIILYIISLSVIHPYNLNNINIGISCLIDGIFTYISFENLSELFLILTEINFGIVNLFSLHDLTSAI